VAAETPSPAKILIIDDEESNVVLLEALFRRAGYRNVRSTTDSRHAIALCEEIRPDVILLDLRMPHVTGFELLEQLRGGAEAIRHVPVLVLTADLTREAVRATLQVGAQDFLTKPFDNDELLLRVRNLLEVRRLQVQLRRRERLLDEQAKTTSRRRTGREREPERSSAEDDIAEQVRMLKAIWAVLENCLATATPEHREQLTSASAMVQALLDRAARRTVGASPTLEEL
jgi:CheY-like chemotaxis protein